MRKQTILMTTRQVHMIILSVSYTLCSPAKVPAVPLPCLISYRIAISPAACRNVRSYGRRPDDSRMWPGPALGQRGHRVARHRGKRRHQRVRRRAVKGDHMRAGQRRLTDRPEAQRATRDLVLHGAARQDCAAQSVADHHLGQRRAVDLQHRIQAHVVLLCGVFEPTPDPVLWARQDQRIARQFTQRQRPGDVQEVRMQPAPPDRGSR